MQFVDINTCFPNHLFPLAPPILRSCIKIEQESSDAYRYIATVVDAGKVRFSRCVGMVERERPILLNGIGICVATHSRKEICEESMNESGQVVD